MLVQWLFYSRVSLVIPTEGGNSPYRLHKAGERCEGDCLGALRYKRGLIICLEMVGNTTPSEYVSKNMLGETPHRVRSW